MTSINHVVSRNLGSVKYRFPNNYGASVVQNEYSYGGDAGYYEIAVLKFHSDNNEDYTLDYDTSVTNDVIGWVCPTEIDKYLAKIESL